MGLFSASSSSRHDVLIVGAGPAGLGCAVALKACGVEKLAILDRRGVGASFERWPAQMRMITPSFHSNPFGQVDLNAITPQTSVADYLGLEHPSGPDYARYLRAVADHSQLPVESGIEVMAVKRKGREFVVETSEGPRRARYVLLDQEGVPFEISTPPILCTGFRGALRGVEEYFYVESDVPFFTEEANESPVTEALFCSGPALRHRGTLFCFIYKFRARFGIVASEIATRLGLEWEGPLKLWRERGFLVEDLACCTDCRCDVQSEAGGAEAEDCREARVPRAAPVMTRK